MSGRETREPMDVRTKLSTLWIFAMFNYLYADVMTLMDPVVSRRMASAAVGAIPVTPQFLLGAAVLMETAIAMVVLSRVLRRPANRLLNIAAGVLHTAAVTASLFVGGGPALYYVFFAAMEIACTLFIIWQAWQWKPAGEAREAVSAAPTARR